MKRTVDPRPECGGAATRWRLEPAVLLLLPAVWSLILFSPGYSPDPDTYFHVGVARRIAEHGWLGEFPWLPYTSLADPYPDLFVAVHLLLVPLAALLPLSIAVPASVLLLSCGLAISLYLVMRRRGVALAAWWVTLGMLACPPTLLYQLSIKGGAGLFIVLLWFADALWSDRPRRVFVLAWLSVYAYVGASVLLPLAAVHVACVRAIEGRWRPVLLLATVGGLLAGMVAHPAWPAQWGNVAGELSTIWNRDARLGAGVLHGAEWLPLPGPLLFALAGPSLAAWAVVIARRLGRAEPLDTAAAGATVAALGLLGAALPLGSKMLYLGVLLSIVAVPLAARASGWPRWLGPVIAALAIAVAARNVIRTRDDMTGPGMAHPAQYQTMARWLDARTEPGEVVLAPWDDFPGLFLFGGEQRYVAGWSLRYLLEHDRRRFDAFALLYDGAVTDPERLLPELFDGARWLLVRTQPRNPGELALLSSLTANPHFEEIATPVATWRVFRVR